MRILHIYKNYYPFSVGGVEKHIHSLSASLYEKGIECAIVTTQQNPSVSSHTIDNCRVHYFPATFEIASCPFSFKLLRNFRGLARDFDILHYHFPWPFADLTSLVSSMNKPIVVTYHSDIIRQKWLKLIYEPIMHLFLNQADAIIASSNNYLQSSPVLKKYTQKTIVIPFGLDRSQYPTPPEETITYWRNQVGENFFLFVGVLRYYKGLEFLLEAVRNTNIPVVIAGCGPEEIGLAQIKAKHKMDNVKFVGRISEQDKTALYQLCRASVVPSHLRTEAFCISLLESLIYGKPAISTELNTGTSFVNQHNVSGLVVPPANPPAIKQAMQLLLTDETLYQRLKQGTHTHYQQHFKLNSMRDRHIELYNQL